MLLLGEQYPCNDSLLVFKQAGLGGANRLKVAVCHMKGPWLMHSLFIVNNAIISIFLFCSKIGLGKIQHMSVIFLDVGDSYIKGTHVQAQ